MAAATLADGYGDAKNPYGSKAKGNVLAAPSNAAGIPAFRSLMADDIPQLPRGKIADLYPVGAVYLSVSSTSPASLFGGTWEPLSGRFLMGAGAGYDAGAIGGSADAVVVSHGHTFAGVNRTGTASGFPAYPASSGSGVLSIARISSINGRGGSLLPTWSINFSMTPEGSISASGESGAGKNMPPYLAVYMWKRIA
ncbi:MAG: phage baseplate protein [Sphaerochaetaceae bacterium]